MTNPEVLALARERYPHSAGEEPDTVLFELLVDVADAYLEALEAQPAAEYDRTLAAVSGQTRLGCLLAGLRENLEMRRDPSLGRPV
jgi:hypothetical protein